MSDVCVVFKLTYIISEDELAYMNLMSKAYLHAREQGKKREQLGETRGVSAAADRFNKGGKPIGGEEVFFKTNESMYQIVSCVPIITQIVFNVND